MLPIKIAIADDHLLFRKGIITILGQSPSFEFVLEAINGKDLIDALSMNTTTMPDVILMDVQMPIINGIEATEYIKEHFPTIKILVLSMHDEDSFVTRLMELGANGYLLKDTDPDEVEKAIKAVHEEEYYYGAFLTKVMHRKMLKKTVAPPRENTRFGVSVPVNLTDRELEILRLICDGFTNAEIADKVFLSPRTVDGHRTRIMEKVGVKNTAGLVVYAVKNNLY